jgi:DNA-binding NarL/FixJ family response regulator
MSLLQPDQTLADQQRVDRRRTVVVADDDDAVRNALVELLSDVAAFRVVGSGGDADAAIVLCHQFRPEILLLDVNMPAGGGERAARIVAHELPETVIVALSGRADRGTRRRMLAAGADAFVAKGSTDELVTLLAAAHHSVEQHNPFHTATWKDS